MAIKTYRMNLKRTYARIIVKGETGNEVVYEFTNGNPAGSIPAKCTIRGEYEQNLLEGSDLFKRRIVALESVSETASEKEARLEEERRKASMLQEPEIKTVTEAINYVAEHFDVAAKTASQAKAIAEQNGVCFPNLRVGKK